MTSVNAERSNQPEIIAEREFTGPGGHPVWLRIGKPYLPANQLSWFCDVEIVTAGKTRRQVIGGADSLQALMLGLSISGVMFRMTPEFLSGEVSFLGNKDDLQLPEPPPPPP